MNSDLLLWRSAIALGVLAVVLAAAPGAFAAQRFAAPTPAGTQDCSSVENACGVVTAVNDAGANDEVILASGNYGDAANPITTELLLDVANLNVHGTPGSGRPVLFTAGSGPSAVRLTAANAQLRDVEIRNTNDIPGVRVNIGTLERVVAVNSGGDDAACLLTGGAGSAVLRNSVCQNTSGLTEALGAQVETGGTGTFAMRNITAVSSGTGGIGLHGLQTATGTATANVTNVIAQGGFGGADVLARTNGTGSMTLNVDHSNYDSEHETGPGTESVTDPGTGTNQNAAPLLSADFRQLAGSPTVEAGATDAADGTADVDGDSRTIGSSTDIGADEFVPSASSPGTGASPAAAGGATGAGVGTALLAPSNLFSLGKFDPLTGEWVINVPGPGGLVVEDAATAKKSQAAAKRKRKKKRKKAALIKTVRNTATKAGPVRLKLALSRAGKAKLRKSGRVAVNVRVTYAPTGGKPRSTDKRVTFKVRRKKRKKR